MNTLKKLSLIAILAALLFGPLLSGDPGSFRLGCACDGGGALGKHQGKAAIFHAFLPLP